MNPSNQAAGRWPALHSALLPAIGIASLLMAGCATAPPPTEQVAAAIAAMAQAAGAGAPELAAPEMRIASDKIDRLRVALAAKDYRHAAWLAQEAQLDAQVAEARADAAKAQRAADALRDDSQVLRDELQRKTR